MLNDILAEIFLSQPDRPDIIKARLLELAVFLSRAAVEAGADLSAYSASTTSQIQDHVVLRHFPKRYASG